MPTRDKRIDAYIAKAQPFARPILKHIRKLVHTACPDVKETLKWSMPSFEYKGILCGMAAFKQHATFGFWKHKLLLGSDIGSAGAMGSFGKLTSLDDLPSDKVMIDLIKKAAKLNEDGVKVARPKSAPKKPFKTPSYFLAALRKHTAALNTYESFSYSKKKEYVEWIVEAKTDETRKRRMDTAIQWLSEGKPRNWKYTR
jgi:hypothetical protein